MLYSLVHAEVPPVASHFLRASVKRSHAYLSLAKRDTTAPRGLISVDEIHFKTNALYKYDRSFPRGTSASFDNTLIRVLRTGEEHEIRALWEKACAFAAEIERQEIKFDGRNLPEAYNCRAGLMAILKHIGVDFNPPDRAHDISGTQTDLYARVQRRLGG